jgi:hypothetical protein
MRNRRLALAAVALSLATGLLPGWSHAAELAGPSTLSTPASCPADQSMLASLPVLAPWSAPSALEALACGSCSVPICQGLFVGSPCLSPVVNPTCQVEAVCPNGGIKCKCAANP